MSGSSPEEDEIIHTSSVRCRNLLEQGYAPARLSDYAHGNVQKLIETLNVLYHSQAIYCAIPENRFFTLFLATDHQSARYNAFFFGKWKKQNIPIFLVRKNPPIQRYFYFSNFQILGSHRDFLRKWACVISLSMGLPSTNYLILHVTKWKKKKSVRKKSEKFARNPKTNRKKSTKKWCFFFFKVPTDKNIFAARFFFFLNFISFFYFLGPQFHTAH